MVNHKQIVITVMKRCMLSYQRQLSSQVTELLTHDNLLVCVATHLASAQKYYDCFCLAGSYYLNRLWLRKSSYVGRWERRTELQRTTVEEMNGLSGHHNCFVLVYRVNSQNRFSLKFKLFGFFSSQVQSIVFPLQKYIFCVLYIEVSLPNAWQQLSLSSQQYFFSLDLSINFTNFRHCQLSSNQSGDASLFSQNYISHEFPFFRIIFTANNLIIFQQILSWHENCSLLYVFEQCQMWVQSKWTQRMVSRCTELRQRLLWKMVLVKLLEKKKFLLVEIDQSMRVGDLGLKSVEIWSL